MNLMIAECLLIVAEICLPRSVVEIQLKPSTTQSYAIARTQMGQITLAFSSDFSPPWAWDQFSKACAESACVRYWRSCEVIKCAYTIGWDSERYITLEIEAGSAGDLREVVEALSIFPAEERHDLRIPLATLTDMHSGVQPPMARRVRP